MNMLHLYIRINAAERPENAGDPDMQPDSPSVQLHFFIEAETRFQVFPIVMSSIGSSYT
jgi:hypothetical protein